MKILVTAATTLELDAVNSRWREGSEKKHTIDLLVTGLGATATTYTLTKALAHNRYDLLLNIGIAGSFSDNLPIGSVAVVTDECFADIGTYNGGRFTTAFDMGLLEPNNKPFTNGWLHCAHAEHYIKALNLPKAKAITVNTITATAERAEELKELFSPEIESMEGAAFFYVCLFEDVPFLQIRSVSNMAGIRDKSKWNILLALQNLSNVLNKLFVDV